MSWLNWTGLELTRKDLDGVALHGSPDAGPIYLPYLPYRRYSLDCARRRQTWLGIELDDLMGDRWMGCEYEHQTGLSC